MVLEHVLDLVAAERRHLVESLQVLRLVETEGAGLALEEVPVGLLFVVEELADEQGGKMSPRDDDGYGHLPQTVAALVDEGLTLGQTALDEAVAHMAALEGGRIGAVECGADALPAGSDEDRPVDAVDDGGGHACRPVVGVGRVLEDGQIKQIREAILAHPLPRDGDNWHHYTLATRPHNRVYAPCVDLTECPF